MKEWKEISIGSLGKIITGYTPKTDDAKNWNGTYPFYTPSDINSNKYCPKTSRFVTDKSLQKDRVLQTDSILVTCIASIGKMALVKEAGICNQQINAVSCSGNFNPHYVYYLLSFNVNELFKIAGSTAVPILNKKQFEGIKIYATTSLTEQTHIANILSTADEAIAQTEQLIAKYQRIKTGLMQDLLTKGIDEHGNIRNKATHKFVVKNGVEVPEEWEVVELGKLAKFNSGFAFRFDQLREHGIKVVRISNLHKTSFPFWRYDGPVKETWIVENDDVLFTWAGISTSIDCVKYYGEKALLNQHIYNFKFENDVIKNYTHKYLQFFLPKLRMEIEGGAGQLHLTKDKIQKIKIPFMSPQEMSSINSKLDSIDLCIENASKNLQKLHSLKTGLMQDLLSGRVRVNDLKE